MFSSYFWLLKLGKLWLQNSLYWRLRESCPGVVYDDTRALYDDTGAVVAQLASARLSEQEVSGLILGDLNVCSDFPLIRVAIALNSRKTEH